MSFYDGSSRASKDSVEGKSDRPIGLYVGFAFFAAVVAVAIAFSLKSGAIGFSAKKQALEASDNSVEKRLMKQLERKKENAPPLFVTMDEFSVNLPGKGGEHSLQTKLVLRTAEPTTEQRIADSLPLVRERVLAVLSSSTVDEMATVEGKDRMAKDIALVINAIIEPQLTAIFVLQQEPSTADLRNLERLGVLPREASGGGSYSSVAKEAAAQFWKVTEMDLPVQAVLFNALAMK